MNTFIYKGSEDTPSITLDAENGFFEISGRSMPEDVASFYNPVLDWIDEYFKNPNSTTVFHFKLTYFNTASSKLILDIMVKLEDMHSNGNDISIKWHYPDIDEDMKEAGEEYADMIEVPFEQIAYSR